MRLGSLWIQGWSLDDFQQLEKTLQLKQHALDRLHSGQLIPSKFRWAMVLGFA
jgi:hypothetical protein